MLCQENAENAKKKCGRASMLPHEHCQPDRNYRKLFRFSKRRGDWKIVYLCYAYYYFRILERGCELGSDSSARNTSARVYDDMQC
jgi:hypothetical protein